MAGPRPVVPAPSFTARQYGLISVAQPGQEGDQPGKWRNGVTWQGVCPTGATTFDDYCVTGVGAPTKTENVSLTQRGATPITAYAKIDCSPPGATEAEHRSRALDALSRVEELQIEAAFWTGTVAGGSGAYTAYPHLAANAEVFDSPGSLVSVLLQPAVTSVTGVTLDVVEALGRLEHALAGCLGGRGVIHMTAAVADAAWAQGLLDASGGRLSTRLGNQVAVGAGYTGSSPAGVSTAGVHWMYATGPVFIYREDQAQVLGDKTADLFDRETNTMEVIAERTYVVGFDCCLLGAPVSLGGEIAGAFNATT